MTTGKSTLMGRMLTYASATGVTPLVLGDLKPDYTATVEWLGGQVIPVGRGVGGINILDPGEMGAAADRIGGQAGQQLRAEAHGRTLAITCALITLVRGRPVDDHEQTVLAACLHHLAGRTTVPVLPDLVTVLAEGPERVRAVTLDRGSERRYWYFAILDELWRPLRAAGGLVDRIDAITRLNRTWGLGQAMITHTLKDLDAIDSPADRAKGPRGSSSGPGWSRASACPGPNWATWTRSSGCPAVRWT